MDNVVHLAEDDHDVHGVACAEDHLDVMVAGSVYGHAAHSWGNHLVSARRVSGTLEHTPHHHP